MHVAKKSGLPDPSAPNQGLHISSGGTGHQQFSFPQLQVEKAKFLVGVLQKPVLKNPSTTLGELENSGLLVQRAQRSSHPKLWAPNKGLEFLIPGQA